VLAGRKFMPESLSARRELLRPKFYSDLPIREASEEGEVNMSRVTRGA